MSGDLREIIKDALAKQNGVECDYGELQKLCDVLEELWRSGRKEGLLRLEYVVWDVLREKAGLDIEDEPDSEGNYLHVRDYPYKKLTGAYRLLVQMLLLILDGTEPGTLEEVAVLRYHAVNYEGLEALKACMVIVGMLDIQKLESPRIMTEKLFALLPEEAENRMIEAKLAKDSEKYETGKSDTEEEKRAVFCEEFFADAGAGESRVMEIVNQVFMELKDEAVQGMVFHAEDKDLHDCLAAMSGSARRKVFDNMSSWRANRAYSSVCARLERKGGFPLETAEKAAIRILKLLLRFIERGVIWSEEIEQTKQLIEEAFAWQDHKIADHNRKIKEKIEDLEGKISNLKRELRED